MLHTLPHRYEFNVACDMCGSREHDVLPRSPNDAAAKLRDLLDHKDLATAQNSYTTEVPKHGVVLLKVSK